MEMNLIRPTEELILREKGEGKRRGESQSRAGTRAIRRKWSGIL